MKLFFTKILINLVNTVFTTTFVKRYQQLNTINMRTINEFFESRLDKNMTWFHAWILSILITFNILGFVGLIIAAL